MASTPERAEKIVHRFADEHASRVAHYQVKSLSPSSLSKTTYKTFLSSVKKKGNKRKTFSNFKTSNFNRSQSNFLQKKPENFQFVQKFQKKQQDEFRRRFVQQLGEYYLHQEQNKINPQLMRIDKILGQKNVADITSQNKKQRFAAFFKRNNYNSDNKKGSARNKNSQTNNNNKNFAQSDQDNLSDISQRVIGGKTQAFLHGNALNQFRQVSNTKASNANNHRIPYSKNLKQNNYKKKEANINNNHNNSNDDKFKSSTEFPANNDAQSAKIEVIKALRSKMGINNWKYQKNIDHFIKRMDDMQNHWALFDNMAIPLTQKKNINRSANKNTRQSNIQLKQPPNKKQQQKNKNNSSNNIQQVQGRRKSLQVLPNLPISQVQEDEEFKNVSKLARLRLSTLSPKGEWMKSKFNTKDQLKRVFFQSPRSVKSNQSMKVLTPNSDEKDAHWYKTSKWAFRVSEKKLDMKKIRKTTQRPSSFITGQKLEQLRDNLSIKDGVQNTQQTPKKINTEEGQLMRGLKLLTSESGTEMNHDMTESVNQSLYFEQINEEQKNERLKDFVNSKLKEIKNDCRKLNYGHRKLIKQANFMIRTNLKQRKEYEKLKNFLEGLP